MRKHTIPKQRQDSNTDPHLENPGMAVLEPHVWSSSGKKSPPDVSEEIVESHALVRYIRNAATTDDCACRQL